VTREELSEFFARRDADWQKHDSAALAASHSESGVIDSPLRGKVEGCSAIQDSYADFFISFPDAQYSTEHLLIDGNRVVQFTEMTGTQKGDFCGLPPTGKRFRMKCVSLFSFADDRIVYEYRIYDFTSILLQLGVLKAKPAF
jgi:steroid delta-isomerase-like uncharacterized protein